MSSKTIDNGCVMCYDWIERIEQEKTRRLRGENGMIGIGLMFIGTIGLGTIAGLIVGYIINTIKKS